jgi:arabinofuranosyltransferase
LFLGLTPLLAWFAFATLYYGTPLPNTAYAKVFGVQAPRREFLVRGLWYYRENLGRDPITLIVIAVGLALGFSNRERRVTAWLSAGIALHLLYLLKVGGDFMAGRFLTLPFVLSVFLIGRARLPRAASWCAAVAAVLLGLLTPRSNLLSGRDYDERGVSHGIADVRGVNFQSTGLLSDRRNHATHLGRPDPEPPPLQSPAVVGAIGHIGFMYGRSVDVLDYFGLADPLLARLPGKSSEWRVGHVARAVPWGYSASLRTGENRIEDPDLHAYYEALRTLSRGRLFSLERLRVIADFHLGRYDDELERYVDGAYGKEGLPKKVRLDDLAVPLPETGSPLTDAAVHVPASGVDIELGTPSKAHELVVAVDGQDTYGLLFRHEGKRVGIASILPSEREGLVRATVSVPPSAVAASFDQIWVLLLGGNGESFLGGLILQD